MPATLLAAKTSLEMIGLRKYNQAIFKVVVHYAVLLIPILTVVGHLNTTCVGPIPTVKELISVPELL